jgi:hypothetical protein
MSSPSSAAASVSSRERNHDRARPDDQCVGMTGMLGSYVGMGIADFLDPSSSSNRRCKRHVVWAIDGVGVFCNHCFEAFFAANWRDVTLEMIHRLSNREEDFFQSSGNERHR